MGLFLSILFIVSIVVVFVVLYLEFIKYDKSDDDEGDKLGRVKRSLLVDMHTSEWIHFDKGYYVYHRFKLEPEEVILIERAISDAMVIKPQPANIMIANGTRHIRISKGDAYAKKPAGSMAYEFWPQYDEGEFQGFDSKPAENYY